MNTDKLDRFLDEMPLRGIPGCDLSVTRNGHEVYRRAVGYSDAEMKRPVDRDTLWWIFSASKVITCTAAMRLVEEGRLKLTDRVSDYLPAFGSLTVRQKDGTVVPAQEPMRIVHLFTMTGGMDYDTHAPEILDAVAAGCTDTVSLCSAMANRPLGFEPGTRYRYSLCHDVLAAVIEVVTGMKFSDYLHELMFEPLGMTDTGFRPTEEQLPRFAQAFEYNNADGSIKPIAIGNDMFVPTPEYESGGAGLFTTVDDYMKVITALACDGTSPDGYVLLNPETIAEMEVNRLCPAAWKDFVAGRLFGYGWGLCGRVHVNPVRSLARSSVGEFGWDGAQAAYAMVDRKTRTALYFGTQVGNCVYAYNVLHPTLRDLVFEMLDEK